MADVGMVLALLVSCHGKVIALGLLFVALELWLT
jgi:hypothetical protein